MYYESISVKVSVGSIHEQYPTESKYIFFSKSQDSVESINSFTNY